MEEAVSQITKGALDAHNDALFHFLHDVALARIPLLRRYW